MKFKRSCQPKFYFRRAAVFIVLAAGLSAIAATAAGEDRMALSISPPLVKINMKAGESWQSAVKVANNNLAPATVYVEILDFKSSAEGGVEFIEIPGAPVDPEATSTYLLSRWIEVPAAPVTIPPQRSAEIPFSVRVPDYAEPGGHYAAILVGTKPLERAEGTAIKISSLIASLLMLNVSGDVVEAGRIREFSTEKKFYGQPQAVFTVRFDNTGNVHLQPRGEIVVTDMFNRPQGRITINHNSQYGHVLPESTRRWQFDWQGGNGFFDQGRYKAELILSFGETGQEAVYATGHFWVINYRLLGIVLGALAGLALLVALGLKFYIRQAVRTAQKEAGLIIEAAAGAGGQTVVKNNRLSRLNWRKLKRISLLVIISLLAVSVTALAVSLSDLNSSSPADEAALAPPPADPAQIEDDFAAAPPVDATTTAPAPETGAADKDYNIRVLNGSGRPGLAGIAADIMEKNGLKADFIGNADRFDQAETAVIYRPEAEELARRLGEIFSPAPEMVMAGEGDAADITMIIGFDFIAP